MNKIADVIFYFAVVSGILVLTRPGSKGPAFVTALGTSVAHVEQAATGQKLG